MSTVLIVDDSPTLREMLTDLLRKSGHAVIQASDGVDAQEKLGAGSSVPDLVVMDVVMPRMNGYELCRWIKKNPQTQDVPVIMCTSKSEEFDRYWGMKQGADAYVTKPYHPDELMGVVRQLLSR